MKRVVTIQNTEEEKFLRKKTSPLNINEIKNNPEKRKEIKTLIKEMREIMKRAEGVGLSANQIGLQHRLFVAQVPDGQGHPKFYAVLNPEIIKTSKKTGTFDEGCLSVPERYGPTERHYEITLIGFDSMGRKLKIKAWGILARVFQHEVDHLDGKLFIEKAKEVYKITDNNKKL